MSLSSSLVIPQLSLGLSPPPFHSSSLIHSHYHSLFLFFLGCVSLPHSLIGFPHLLSLSLTLSLSPPSRDGSLSHTLLLSHSWFLPSLLVIHVTLIRSPPPFHSCSLILSRSCSSSLSLTCVLSRSLAYSLSLSPSHSLVLQLPLPHAMALSHCSSSLTLGVCLLLTRYPFHSS